MFKHLSILFFFFLTWNIGNAQFFTSTNNTYLDTSEFNHMAIAIDNNGNSYYAVKAHYIDYAPGGDDFEGIKILKYNSSGTKTGSFFFRYTSSGNGESVQKMIFANNSLYVLINGKFDASPFDYDIVLLKLNVNTMNQVWMQAYNHGATFTDDICIDMLFANNHIYIVGQHNQNTILLKYSTAGSLIVAAEYNFSSWTDDLPVKLINHGSELYVLGWRHNTNGNLVQLLKYDSNLSLLWNHTQKVATYPYEDAPGDVVTDPPGNIYICGSYSTASGQKPFIQKLNPVNGNRIWIKKPSTISGHFSRVFTDTDDNPYGIIAPMPYRFYKVDKNTAVVIRNQTLFNSSSINFNLVDVIKGGNNLYIGGGYDSTYTWINPDDSSEFEIMDSGIKVFKLNINGSRSGIFTAGDDDGHNWETTPRLAFKSNKLYCIYNYNSVAVSFGENESWCKINCANFSVPIREGDIEKTDELNIWPNPNSGMVSFRLPEVLNSHTTWELFSVEGKLLNSGQIEIVPSKEEYRIETGKYATGTYIFRITNEEIQYHSLIQME